MQVASAVQKTTRVVSRFVVTVWQSPIHVLGSRFGYSLKVSLGIQRDGLTTFHTTLGTWSPQRSIVRQNVTAIKFIEDGEGLVGGTTDGVL